MVVSRIERAVGQVDLDALQRIGVALDRPLLVSFGRDLIEGPADAGHLAIQELVLRLAKDAGFAASVELMTGPVDSWRAADVMLSSEHRHRLIVVECWNTIADVGAAVRSSDRKRADAAILATRRWNEDAQIGLVWVVRATARNRSILSRYPQIFAARFPGSSRDWVRTLTAGGPLPNEPGLVWSDVGATRLSEWRR